ncbi:MAG: RNA-binding protein [Alphaproteobacteria bacterium]|nr:RNA-binding protein [Alphaproteobacteria bacterium]MCB9928892.1 RNA-binding protein [Alphaproteobacteria bacterium]
MTAAVQQQNDAQRERRPTTGGDAPTRRCIVSRQPRPRYGLIRFVLDPDRTVVPDLAEVLPGRGLWVSADRAILEKACKNNTFAKAARGPATVPDGLVATVTDLLRARCLAWLGQARGAGQLQSGFFQVREALAHEGVAVLIEAVDGAANGKAKLAGAARGLPLVDWFTAVELGNALGRDHLVHLALAPGKLSERFVHDALRYSGMLGGHLQGAGGEQ